MKDIAYFLNREIENDAKKEESESQLKGLAVINTSIEESTLGVRQHNVLLEQDVFLRDHLGPQDVIVCSVGGNDIAFRPSYKTVFNILIALSTASLFGTTSSGWVPGLGHFVNLFGDKTKQYLECLIEKYKPKVIVVCMIYFLDENPEVDSWANFTLEKLRYNSKPSILQGFITYVFQKGTSKIEINGVKIVPIPLFQFLDGSCSADYVDRVEPSVQGGEKMASGIWSRIKNEFI